MKNSIITKYRILFGCIIIGLLITYSDASSGIPSLFGFPVNSLSDFDSDQSFEIKEVNDILCYNFRLDSLFGDSDDRIYSDRHFSSILFENLNEKQIDSTINLIKYPFSVIQLVFQNCNIKMIPKSVKSLNNLYSIHFKNCDLIENINGFNSCYPIFGLNFEDCKLTQLPEGIENISSMLRLMLRLPDDYKDLDINKELRKFKKRNNIIDLCIIYNKLSDFPESIFELTSLQTLIFFSDSIKYYPAHYDKLNNLINLYISSFDDRVDESAMKNKSFHYLKRLESQDLLIDSVNYCGLRYSWRAIGYNLVNYNCEYSLHLNYGGKFPDKTSTYKIGSKAIDIATYGLKRHISINFKDAKINDKLSVQISDREGKILFNGKINNKNCELDFTNLESAEYYMKININTISKKFNIQISW